MAPTHSRAETRSADSETADLILFITAVLELLGGLFAGVAVGVVFGASLGKPFDDTLELLGVIGVTASSILLSI